MISKIMVKIHQVKYVFNEKGSDTKTTKDVVTFVVGSVLRLLAFVKFMAVDTFVGATVLRLEKLSFFEFLWWKIKCTVTENVHVWIILSLKTFLVFVIKVPLFLINDDLTVKLILFNIN